MPLIACTTTDPAPFGNYISWLQSLRGGVDIRFVTSESDLSDIIQIADGLLLPGGGDPEPALYGRPEARGLCTVDEQRDRLELNAIESAIRRGLPILGICRGLQIATVALGGTLIPDLPTAGYEGHHRLTQDDRRHEVRIEADSLLAAISGEIHGIVNSAHHQGVDRIPPRLRAVARSADGLPEALEWSQPEGKPFLLLLHWHPERLEDGHPLKDCLGLAFLDACSQVQLREQ